MHGRRVSTVTAYTAHREWARRPPDERYASVHALSEAARARRHRTEERITETVDLEVQAATADALASRDRSGPTRGPDPLELRAARRPRRCAARVSPNAARADRGRRDQCRAAPCRPRTSISSSRIGTTRGPSTRLPLRGTRGSTTTSWPTACSTSWPSTRPGTCRSDTRTACIGAERVPSGAYLGDRDMFLFLVDGNRILDDPTDASQAGLFRGFMLRNSDVGAAALTLDMFLFRAVCANHIIWGFHHVAGFRRRHMGASIHDAWTALLRDRPRGARRQPRRRSRPTPASHAPRSSARRASR